MSMLGREKIQAELTDTEAFCAKLLKPGSVYEFLANHRRELFADEHFVDLYPSGTGRPSVPASRVASIMVLQILEGLSDREAMEQVRSNLYWKMALGVPLDYEGFSPNVLTLWRNRIAASQAPNRIFDIVAQVVAGTGLIRSRNKRALDSTVLGDAVATQDTFTQIVAQIRRVRRAIPALSQVELTAGFDYGSKDRKPDIDYSDEAERSRAVTELIGDANALIQASESLDLSQSEQEAIGLLALVAGQDVEIVDEVTGRFAIATKVARDRVVSVVDPASRHAHKSRRVYLDGYKGHISVEPDTEVVTKTAFTKGNQGDAASAKALLDAEKEPVVVYGDTGYSSAQLRGDLQREGHAAVIKCHPLSMAVPGGFSIDDFEVDEGAGVLTCPAGNTAPISAKGRASFERYCAGCPLRERCTRSKRGRVVTIDSAYLINRSARRHFADPAVRADYNANRPTVERIHAQMKRKMNSAKVRYRGIAKNAMYYSAIAATWNLRVLLRNGLTRHGGQWVLAPG